LKSIRRFEVSCVTFSHHDLTLFLCFRTSQGNEIEKNEKEENTKTDDVLVKQLSTRSNRSVVITSEARKLTQQSWILDSEEADDGEKLKK
jgi:hypothetical protein